MKNKYLLTLLSGLFILVFWLSISPIETLYVPLRGVLHIQLRHLYFCIINFFIPVLWIIFLIFLFTKNYGYIGAVSYVILSLILFSEKIAFGFLSFNQVFSYSCLMMFFSFLFIVIAQEITNKRFKLALIITQLMAICIYIIPLLFLIYTLNSGTIVTTDVLYAVFQTNPSESIAYIFNLVAMRWSFLFVVIISGIGYLFFRHFKQRVIPIKRVLLSFIILCLGILVCFRASDFRLFNVVRTDLKNYQNELHLFKAAQLKLQTDKIRFHSTKTASDETYIVVIGESLNKHHMSLYNYMRPTNPLLSQHQDLLIFKNVYSNHTHTNAVVSLAFTEANQLNNKAFYKSLSILNILNQANIETYWITNQKLYSAWDSLSSILAHQADHLIPLNYAIGSSSTPTREFDDAVLQKVDNILAKKSKKNKVIFVHLMGNHVNYHSRYPADYSVFSAPLKKGVFGTQLSKSDHFSNRINQYDNSVLYNDYVVHSILSLLQTQNKSTGFLYFSDHAEDVVRGLGHDSVRFTYEMTQIPMIAWFSDLYKERYPQKYNTLKNRIHTLYCNDFLYDTLIGMINIQTTRYNSSYDLTSLDYHFEEKDAYTLHSKQPYINSNHFVYHQSKNISYLKDIHQLSRIIPHRINSIGRLYQAWHDGYRSFEVDVHFFDNDPQLHYFQVGHDSDTMGENFELFLSTIDYHKLQKVWFDLKNLTQDNVSSALKHLTHLDRRFNLKQILIVESTSPDLLKSFSEFGWHTTYYLPTNRIITLFNSHDIFAMTTLAQKMSQQILDQNLSAISFDYRLYPFVHTYLTPIIPKTIKYHTWDFSLILSDATLQQQLPAKKYYNNPQFNTILLPYYSIFNL